MERFLENPLFDKKEGESYAFLFFKSFIENSAVLEEVVRIEKFGEKIGGKKSLNGLRKFEYPFVAGYLNKNLKDDALILDIGTKNNPIPWYFDRFQWITSDTRKVYFDRWDRWNQSIDRSKKYDKSIINAQNITLKNASLDAYVSISVIEHIPEKESVFEELARVLKPCGQAIISFDWIDKKMNMSWKHKVGNGLTPEEINADNSINRYFQPIKWLNDTSDQDVLDFYKWHKSLNYNYSGGVMILERNSLPFPSENSFKRLKQGIFQKLSAHALFVEYIGALKGLLIQIFPFLTKYRKKNRLTK